MPEISEIDTGRVANMLLKNHGDGAEAEADRQGAAQRERGDVMGVEVWRRIKVAVGQLRKQTPAAGERVQ
jgi:hypothetical protein